MSKARVLSKLVTDAVFTVDSSDNVGVGSTVPSKKLDVVGIISATSFMGDGSSIVDIDAANISAGVLPDARLPATLPARSGANLTSLNASNLASGTLPDARFPATLPAISGQNLTSLPAGSVLTQGNTKAEVVDTGSDGHFLVETEGTERLRVTNSGLVDVSGGIQVSENVTPTTGSGLELFKPSGTASQVSSFNRDTAAWMDLILKGNKLDVYTAGSERLSIAADGTSLFSTSTIFLRETDSTAAQLMIQNSTTGTGTGDGLLLGIDNNEIAYIYNYENTALVFGTNNTEVFRATTTGQFNVGSGSFVVESDGDISTNIRSHGHIELDSTGGFSDPPVKLYANTGAAEFENPSGDTSLSIGDKSNTDGRLILTAKTSVVEIHSRSDKPIDFLFATATKSKMLTDGSLLLGTTTATNNTDRLLQVGDTSRSSSYIEVRTGTSGASGVVFSDAVDGSDTGYRGTIEYAHSTDLMNFKTAGAQRVTIDSSGNMGVQGNVSASGYILSGLSALP